MPPRHDVRPATREDLAFLQHMLYEASNRPGAAWPPLEQSLDELRNRRFWTAWPRDGDVGVVAEADGTPVGAAWIRRFSGDELSPTDDPDIAVLAIGVEPGHRGAGVGHALMGELMDLASFAGHHAIDLTTGLSNEPAVRLYRTHGFEVIAERGTSVQMRARLGPPGLDR